jgi:dTMP kinase
MSTDTITAGMQRLKGRFIVLDGIEGCGKTTQIRLLGDRLEEIGLSVVLVRDPGTTRIGERIRAILLDHVHNEMGMRCEMLLYMAARAQMMVEYVMPALRSGMVVVSDRFVSSTLAYQLGGDGLTAEEIRAVGETAIRGCWPDVTVILDVPVDAGMARTHRDRKSGEEWPTQQVFTWYQHEQRQEDRIERRPAEYHEQVRRSFLAQAKADPARYRVVSADRSIQEVQAEVWRVVMELAG